MRRRIFLSTTLASSAWAPLAACGGDSAPEPSIAPPAPAPGPSAAPAPPGAAPTAAPTPPPTPPPTAPPGGSTYSLNFASAAVENPLSAGGVWSNNTQGVGGNIAPMNMTSMRVALASNGTTRIAMPTHAGINYDDSFAFVPGFAGNQWCEAVLYKEAGYNPNASGSNHEVELILGCRTAGGTHRWNEFLFNAAGGCEIINLDGGPGSFTFIGQRNSALLGRVAQDGDVLRATKVGNTLSMFVNGTLVATYSGPLAADGSGIGIAGFIRPGAEHNKFGFRSVAMGNL